ncbi:hypothetical protein C7C46_12355 [Streptomyces tateyamensis]|uniref:Uncharacterized protein n=1 Tax=Streptomyces tateyamensis TaxID=565073 RepID=A0A2V4NAT0_9ACTN|nr:hypothetical protein [Streptomyces tateyamensis]PYC80490.1 hypothetical protein C7C46_12355 [Streptomyces tateyamensis]
MTIPETDTVPVWPEGVLARYLTAGGATVDITRGSGVDFTATCLGCGDAQECDHVSATCIGGPATALKANQGAAREWAQAHAERCRALPRP